MFFVKVLLVVATICGTTQATGMFTNVPIIGSVLGTVQNASRTVLDTAADAVQLTGEQIIGRANYFESLIENRIRILLEEMKKLMFDKLPLLGLPRLEPYEHGHQDINIKHEIGIFEGTMDDVVITGLSKFHVDDVKVKIQSKIPLFAMDPNITIDLHYDSLDMSGYYDIKGIVGDFINVFGNGNFALTLRELQINANVKVLLELPKQLIRVDDVAVDIKLGNMTCNFENLMGGGENGDLFNKVIGQLAPEAVEVLWPEIRPGVEAKIKETANNKINELGFQKILEILLPSLVKPKPTTTASP